MKRLLVFVAVMAGLLAGATEPVNVLTLGVKNDASADVSDIINAATEKSALYFPAGRYLVAKPLYLKNPIFGTGYDRGGKVDDHHTWLISAIQNEDASVGVLNFSGRQEMELRDLAILCHSQECGIRVVPCQSTMTWIEKVGIFNVKGYGIFVEGRGSRPIFLDNLTIFGSRDYPIPGVGICLKGVCDNRISNTEIMGCRIGLELWDNYNYGSNLHLWTGCMSGHDNGTWWRGTRSIVLGNHAVFNAVNVYPDTSYYALEARTDDCNFILQNIFYWEDASMRESPATDGAFFHCDKPAPGALVINGGEIYVCGWMQQVATHQQKIRDVIIRSGWEISVENLEKLSAGDQLPDYVMHYDAKGFCHVGDIVMAAPTGCVEAEISTDEGARWRLQVTKKADAAPSVVIEAKNMLCDAHEIKTCEQKTGVLAIYVSNGGTPRNFHFTTRAIGPRFRPIDYGLLRDGNNRPRGYEVKKEF